MKESEFLSQVGMELHQRFLENPFAKRSNHKMTFVVDKDGNLTSFSINLDKVNMTEDLEHHEARLRANLSYNSYHSAIYHLKVILQIRQELLKIKYCV